LRREGRAKLTGRALYVDDVAPAGVIHGTTIRSPAPRGTIREIRFDPAIDWSEYTIVTAADIPGVNVVKLLSDDQPYLAAAEVNHAEEPVVLVAHPDPMRAAAVRRHIAIEIEPLPRRAVHGSGGRGLQGLHCPKRRRGRRVRRSHARCRRR
jgi:CO/xanthine dehydrogenase Mo-binding subunit